MKRALISDIHGNLEALEAVLDDIRSQGIEEVYCLGDIVGYGPDPCKCLDVVIERCRVAILGNHDQAVLIDPDGFNPVALRAVYWTRERLAQDRCNADGDRRWRFLRQLPRTYTEGKRLFVHGSPRDTTNEYVFPEDAYNQSKMTELFGCFEGYCFQGHTHIPGVFIETGTFISPVNCDHRFRLHDQKAMVNIGSVGQPRDGDPRACYAIVDDDVVEFCRVEYRFCETARKIFDTPDLDNSLGERLSAGR